MPPLPAGEGVWALDGRSVPEQKESWVRKCCQEGWLARGWFCRWCGRDEDSGWQGAARGIFGDRAKEREDVRRGFGYCACGCCLGFDWNYGSCRACYWVLTRQLVRRLLELCGSWSPIHDRIFLFLIGPQIRGRLGQVTAARSQMDGLAEVRLLGVLQGSARPQQGVRRGRQGVGVEGQGRIAKRYLRGDVDWVASSPRPVRARLGLAPADGVLPSSSPTRQSIRYPVPPRAGAGGLSVCRRGSPHSRNRETSSVIPRLATGAAVSQSCLATAPRRSAPCN